MESGALDQVVRAGDAEDPAVAELSLDGTVVSATSSFTGRLGVQPDTVAGRSLVDLGVDAEGLAHLLDQARGGTPAGEARLLLHRVGLGCSRVLRVFWSLSRHVDGTPSHVYVVLTQPTAELSVRESALAIALLEHAADATWAADADGKILSVTPGPLQQYGLVPDDVIGTPVFDWIHPDDARAFAAAWERLVARASSREVVECRLALPDQPDRWVQERLTDLRDDPRVGAICGNVVDITGRRRGEQRRALQDRRLRAAFDQSGVPQGVLSSDGRFLDVNPAYCGLLGRSREALLGKYVREITHASDSGRADDVLARLLAGRLDTMQVERVLVGPGGRPLPVLINSTALRGDDGAVEAVISHLHDLSALHSAQQRQQRQEDFFLALSRNATDLAVVVDGDFQIVYASPALRNILGYDPAQVLGSVAFEFVHPDDVDDVRDVYAQVLGEGTTRTLVARVRAADGSWRWMEATATNLLDTAVGGIVTNLRDVTDRIEVERELVLANKRYQDVFTATSLGILLVTLDAQILDVNAAFCRLVGYSRAELLGSYADRLLADQSMTLEQRQARARLHGGTGYELEEVFVRSDGTEVPVLITVNLIEHADEGAGQISLVVRDQTRLKELQAQLVRSERLEAAGRVAAGVAHDTNNILAAVSGYAEMLGAAVSGQADAERHLAGIRRSIERAHDMVTQMLAFTRGQHLAVAPVDLRDVVRDLEDMLRRLLADGVRLTLDAQPAPTLADASQVRQIVLNLVVNARDAVQGSGDIHLSTGLREVLDDHVLAPGSFAVLSVRDDGAGMEESVASRCFEPFFSTRVGQGGTGLGLSTAHGIARQSGGDLRVRTAPGVGSTFELLLPAAGADARHAAPAQAPAAAGDVRGAGEHVLVAEDDEEFRAIVVEVLERAGYRVTAVPDGRAAVDADLLPDLLLTDLEMPGLDGNELSAALRERDESLPVVVVSGISGAPALPGVTYLRKPVTPNAVLESVAAALRRRKTST